MRGADPFASRRISDAAAFDGACRRIAAAWTPADEAEFQRHVSAGAARFGDATASQIGEQQLEQRP